MRRQRGHDPALVVDHRGGAGHGALHRLLCLRLADDEHVLSWVAHHLIADLDVLDGPLPLGGVDQGPGQEALVAVADDGRLRLARGPEGVRLRDEGRDVHRTVSKAGHVLYTSKRTADGHGDRWTALTLALKGAGEPTPLRLVGGSPLMAVA